MGLKAWEKFRRRSDVSGSPHCAMNGLEAVSKKKKGIAPSHSSWPEQERPSSKKYESRNESRLIAQLAHQQGSWHGQQKVSHVKRRLDQSCLETRNRKGLHKVADEHIIEIVGNSPKEEQSGYREKREKVARRKECSASSLTCGNFRRFRS